MEEAGGEQGGLPRFEVEEWKATKKKKKKEGLVLFAARLSAAE